MLADLKAKHLWKYLIATYGLRLIYWYNSIPWYKDTVLPLLMTVLYFIMNLISEMSIAARIAWSLMLMVLLFKLPLKRILYSSFGMYFWPIKPIQVYFDADYIYNQLWNPFVEVFVLAVTYFAGSEYEVRLMNWIFEYASHGVLLATITHSMFELIDYFYSFWPIVDWAKTTLPGETINKYFIFYSPSHNCVYCL